MSFNYSRLRADARFAHSHRLFFDSLPNQASTVRLLEKRARERRHGRTTCLHGRLSDRKTKVVDERVVRAQVEGRSILIDQVGEASSCGPAEPRHNCANSPSQLWKIRAGDRARTGDSLLGKSRGGLNTIGYFVTF
jgi:hypothetical protein